MLVASPVSARKFGKLKRLNHTRRFKVWAAADVKKVTLGVNSYLFALWDSVNKLDFEWLVIFVHKLDGLRASYFFTLNFKIGLNNALHLGLNLAKILLGYRRFKVKVIIKPFVSCGAD